MGVAVIDSSDDDVVVQFPSVPLAGRPDAEKLAQWLVSVCHENGATVLLLDGPQGWKDGANGLPHSRRCERELNTPAKTGLPGEVKPRSYGRFVAFSISVFDALAAHGWERYTGDEQRGPGIAYESFPLRSWRSLRLPAIPAKRGCTVSVVAARARELSEAHSLRLPRMPNHDELQALVAGLAGLALERGDLSRLERVGVAPFEREGAYREGFIVSPKAAANPRSG